MRTPPDPLQHAWWLAGRASGLVALGLVTLSVIAGLALGGRLPTAPGGVSRLRSMHEQIALVALVAVAVHGLTLLGDAWLKATPLDLLTPFTIAYRPLWTGLGVVAAELTAILALSFYVRRRIGAHLWRRAHRLTLLAWLLAVLHSLGAGTDAGLPGVRAAVLASTVPVVLRLARRMRGRRAPRLTPAA